MTDGGNWETVDQNTVKKKLSTSINLIRKKQKKAKRQQLVGEAEHALIAIDGSRCLTFFQRYNTIDHKLIDPPPE
jgi:hypothetical protein